MDFFTTEYMLKLGGYEKTYLKFVAGQPLKHAIVKIIQVIVIFFLLSYFIPIFLNQSLTTFFGLILLVALNLGYAYAQINNVKVIATLKKMNPNSQP
jgi:hypothetical protein